MLLFFVASLAFHLYQVPVAEAESVTTTSYTGTLATSQSVFETTLNVASPADVSTASLPEPSSLFLLLIGACAFTVCFCSRPALCLRARGEGPIGIAHLV